MTSSEDENPYCMRCSKHLGMPFHETNEHDEAARIAERGARDVNRDELIEVGARALYDEGEEGPSLEAEQRREGCRTLAEEVIDAVEDLIRADEHAKAKEKYAPRKWGREVAKSQRQETLAELRVKVEALQAEYENATDADHAYYALRDVLTLLEGSSDG